MNSFDAGNMVVPDDLPNRGRKLGVLLFEADGYKFIEGLCNDPGHPALREAAQVLLSTSVRPPAESEKVLTESPPSISYNTMQDFVNGIVKYMHAVSDSGRTVMHRTAHEHGPWTVRIRLNTRNWIMLHVRHSRLPNELQRAVAPSELDRLSAPPAIQDFGKRTFPTDPRTLTEIGLPTVSNGQMVSTSDRARALEDREDEFGYDLEGKRVKLRNEPGALD